MTRIRCEVPVGRKRGAGIVLAPVLAGALLSGCLISGTRIFDFLVGTLNATGGAVNSTTVDLSDNQVFQDHREDIGLIDRVGFRCHVENNAGIPTLVSLWFSTNANLATVQQVEAEATPLIRNLAVPAAGTDITYEQSLGLIQNFETLQDVVTGGVFTVYSTTEPGGSFNLTFEELLLTITFTIGL